MFANTNQVMNGLSADQTDSDHGCKYDHRTCQIAYWWLIYATNITQDHSIIQYMDDTW